MGSPGRDNAHKSVVGGRANQGKDGRHAGRVALADRISDPALGMVGRHLRACLVRAMSDNTVRAKLSVLRRLVAELPVPAERATFDHLEDWWSVRSASREPSTRATELSHVRGFYAWLVLTGRREDNPAARLERPRVGHPKPAGVPRDQILRLLGTLTGRDRRAVALMALCGLRAAEVAEARREHLVSTSSGWVLRVRGKGRKDRDVPVPARLAAELAGHEGLFVTSSRGRKLTPHGVSDLLARILRANGVEATGHRLRHSFAQELYRRTGDILSLGAALGHARAHTTQRYASGDAEAMRAAVDALAGDLLEGPS